MQPSNDYRFSKEHAWVKPADEAYALVGITPFAQEQLGEIVYADLPAIGASFKKEEVFGSIEALKTTSDLFMPVIDQAAYGTSGKNFAYSLIGPDERTYLANTATTPATPSTLAPSANQKMVTSKEVTFCYTSTKTAAVPSLTVSKSNSSVSITT